MAGAKSNVKFWDEIITAGPPLPSPSHPPTPTSTTNNIIKKTPIAIRILVRFLQISFMIVRIRILTDRVYKLSIKEYGEMAEWRNNKW